MASSISFKSAWICHHHSLVRAQSEQSPRNAVYRTMRLLGRRAEVISQADMSYMPAQKDPQNTDRRPAHFCAKAFHGNSVLLRPFNGLLQSSLHVLEAADVRPPHRRHLHCSLAHHARPNAGQSRSKVFRNDLVSRILELSGRAEQFRREFGPL